MFPEGSLGPGPGSGGLWDTGRESGRGGKFQVRECGKFFWGLRVVFVPSDTCVEQLPCVPVLDGGSITEQSRSRPSLPLKGSHSTWGAQQKCTCTCVCGITPWSETWEKENKAKSLDAKIREDDFRLDGSGEPQRRGGWETLARKPKGGKQ